MISNEGKMEQYLLLAKGLKGLALVDLIKKATAEPGLFTFGELLMLQPVQQLRNTEHASALALLELFAYGTISDYNANSHQYGTISDAQKRKLQILTVSSLAESRRTLHYSQLQQALGIDSVRELEDLLITDCIYGGILRGRLDQRARCVHIEHCHTRDIQPEQLGIVIEKLSAWLADAKKTLQGIDAQISHVVTSTAAAEKQRGELVAALASARSLVDAKNVSQESIPVAMDDGGDMAPMLEGLVEGDGRLSGPRQIKRRR